MTYIEWNGLITNESQEKSNRITTVQYNCQNSRIICQETKIKPGTLTDTILSIMNGRPSGENISESVSSVTRLQKRAKWNT